MLTGKYFKSSEIFKNCSISEIFEVLDNRIITEQISFALINLEKIREKFNFPFIVNSWYRSYDHNLRVGGVKNSAHMQGLAIDISLRGLQAKQVVDYIKKNIDQTEIDQLIVYPTFIHIAFDTLMPRRHIIYKRSS